MQHPTRSRDACKKSERPTKRAAKRIAATMTGLRQKMEQVESRFEECYTMMENTEGTVKELWGAAEETKALATSLIREAVEKMQAEFKERDEEMDHKFSLQVAENKRLQGHMAEIRKENKHLYAQVVELQKRCKLLEDEVCGE